MQVQNTDFMLEVTRLIDEGHTVTLPLRGFSMRPFLEDRRDKAVMKSATNVKVGDAVLAETTPGHYVLHRIIRIDGDAATLRGDGNITAETCRLADIKAVAIGFYRKRKQVFDSTTGWKWRTYSWLWMRLYPIRKYLLFLYRHLFKHQHS